MRSKDTYKTIAAPSEGIFKDKGSKFLCFAYPVETGPEAMEKVSMLKDKYHDARHFCFAYVLGFNKEQWRENDDGEPSGSAGKPIMGQITSHNLTNVIVVVVRYFGGTLLGVGGLIKAYKAAATDALSGAKVITKTIDHQYIITFGYEHMSEIMRIFRSATVKNVNYDFREICNIRFDVRISKENEILKQLAILDNVTIKQVHNEHTNN